MRRRSCAWIVTGVTALLGTQVAHALAYDLVARGNADELLAATGHGYAAHLPVVVAFATVVALMALVCDARAAAGTARPRTPSLWPYAAFAPLVFVCQEHVERLVHDGAFPWSAAAEPTFVVGLALQLPFALVAYGVARVLLRAARSLWRRIAGPPHRPRAGTDVPRPAITSWIPRRASLSLGYGTRGPPSVALP